MLINVWIFNYNTKHMPGNLLSNLSFIHESLLAMQDSTYRNIESTINQATNTREIHTDILFANFKRVDSTAPQEINLPCREETLYVTAFSNVHYTSSSNKTDSYVEHFGEFSN